MIELHEYLKSSYQNLLDDDTILRLDLLPTPFCENESPILHEVKPFSDWP
jgi:hypothetical protein